MKHEENNPARLALQGLEDAHGAIEDCLLALKQKHGEEQVAEALAGVLALGLVLDVDEVRRHMDEHFAAEAELEDYGLESGIDHDDWQENAAKPLQGFNNDLGGRFND